MSSMFERISRLGRPVHPVAPEASMSFRDSSGCASTSFLRRLDLENDYFFARSSDGRLSLEIDSVLMEQLPYPLRTEAERILNDSSISRSIRMRMLSRVLEVIAGIDDGTNNPSEMPRSTGKRLISL